MDSSIKSITNPEADGLYIKKNQKMFCDNIKSWKLADWELKMIKEYMIVIKISKDMTCTNERAVAIIAYRD